MARGIEAFIEGAKATRLVTDPLVDVIQKNREREFENERLERELRLRMALAAAEHPESGVRVLPGTYDSKLGFVAEPGAYTEKQQRQLESGIRPTQGPSAFQQLAPGIVLDRSFRNELSEQKLRNAIEEAQAKADIDINKEWRKPFSLTPGQSVGGFDSSGKFTPAYTNPKEQVPVQMQFKDVGDSIIGIDPVSGAERVRHPKKKDYRYEKTANGLLEIRPDGSKSIVEGTAPTGKQDAGKAYSSERVRRIGDMIKGIEGRVSSWNVGPGSLLSYIPGSQAANFEADINALKSNIAFNELAEMRQASKTGGALGQVSDKEGELLQSALGSLSLWQGPSNFRKNLNQIKETLQRWEEAKSQSGAIPSAQPQQFETGDVVEQEGVRYQFDGQNFNQIEE